MGTCAAPVPYYGKSLADRDMLLAGTTAERPDCYRPSDERLEPSSFAKQRLWNVGASSLSDTHPGKRFSVPIAMNQSERLAPLFKDRDGFSCFSNKSFGNFLTVPTGLPSAVSPPETVSEKVQIPETQPPIPTFADSGRLKGTVPCVPNAVCIL
jgi:hypothetical protein